jgi:hypothetical protein
MQDESEERFRAWDEERWRKETELEEQRRREERAHELQVLQLLTRNQPQFRPDPPQRQQMYSFNLPSETASYPRTHSPPAYEEYRDTS